MTLPSLHHLLLARRSRLLPVGATVAIAALLVVLIAAPAGAPGGSQRRPLAATVNGTAESQPAVAVSERTVTPSADEAASACAQVPDLLRESVGCEQGEAIVQAMAEQGENEEPPAEETVANEEGLLVSAAPAPLTTEPLSSAGLSWPLRGRITSLFGPNHPLGIDIAGAFYTEVRAAGDGRVLFAGVNDVYGYFALVSHAGGYTSLYAHFVQPPTVRTGEVVRRGQVVGLVGDSGKSVGPHLHLEIWRNNLLVDPVQALPGIPLWIDPLAYRPTEFPATLTPTPTPTPTPAPTPLPTVVPTETAGPLMSTPASVRPASVGTTGAPTTGAMGTLEPAPTTVPTASATPALTPKPATAAPTVVATAPPTPVATATAPPTPIRTPPPAATAPPLPTPQPTVAPPAPTPLPPQPVAPIVTPDPGRLLP